MNFYITFQTKYAVGGGFIITDTKIVQNMFKAFILWWYRIMYIGNSAKAWVLDVSKEMNGTEGVYKNDKTTTQ